MIRIWDSRAIIFGFFLLNFISPGTFLSTWVHFWVLRQAEYEGLVLCNSDQQSTRTSVTPQSKAIAKVQPGELVSLLGHLEKQKWLKTESSVASPKANPVDEGSLKQEPWSSLHRLQSAGHVRECLSGSSADLNFFEAAWLGHQVACLILECDLFI